MCHRRKPHQRIKHRSSVGHQYSYFLDSCHILLFATLGMQHTEVKITTLYIKLQAKLKQQKYQNTLIDTALSWCTVFTKSENSKILSIITVSNYCTGYLVDRTCEVSGF